MSSLLSRTGGNLAHRKRPGTCLQVGCRVGVDQQCLFTAISKSIAVASGFLHATFAGKEEVFWQKNAKKIAAWLNYCQYPIPKKDAHSDVLQSIYISVYIWIYPENSVQNNVNIKTGGICGGLN